MFVHNAETLGNEENILLDKAFATYGWPRLLILINMWYMCLSIAVLRWKNRRLTERSEGIFYDTTLSWCLWVIEVVPYKYFGRTLRD